MAANPSFAPMLPGFESVPIDDADAMRAAVGASTAAVIVEPILGEAGVYPVPDAVLAAAREACDRSGALLICDEIQSGLGRTGSLWAYEQTPMRPDLITTAKALGGGLPIGACVCSPELADVLEPGDHGSTFAGGPLVAGAALAVLDLVDDPQLLRRVRELGPELSGRLGALDGVREVRGRGLMIGIGLEQGLDAAELAAALLAEGVIVNVPEPGSLRLLPPLMIAAAELQRGAELIGRAIEAGLGLRLGGRGGGLGPLAPGSQLAPEPHVGVGHPAHRVEGADPRPRLGAELAALARGPSRPAP